MNRSSTLIAAVAFLLASVRADAATATWNAATGVWSIATNWLPAAAPQSGAATALVFGDSGSAYTTTNELSNTPFSLNSLTFQYTGGSALVLDGNAVQFSGAGAQLLQSQTGTVQIDLPVVIGAPTVFGGNGSGELILNGALSGTEALKIDGNYPFRLGSPASLIPSQNTFFGGIEIHHGDLSFNHAAVAARTALRLNPVRFTANNAHLSASSEVRCGELSGNSGAFNAIDDTAPFNGQNILIYTLGKTEFGGVFHTIPGGSSTNSGTLTVRGMGEQTLSGDVQVDDSVIIANGATLRLSKSASLANNSNASINLNGGTLILDNVLQNNNNRLRDRGIGQIGIDVVGGGGFSLVGNILGTTETTGQLQLGSSGQARAGAVTLNVTDTSGGNAATVLTVANYSRNSGDSPHSTVNFTAKDGLGNLVTLGRSGNAPRIFFTQAPPLHNGLLSASDSVPEPSSSGPNEHIGWATVNGRDFATYGPNGIAPMVSYPMPFDSSGKYNAVLNASRIIFSTNSFALNSLKIAPASSGQRLQIAGAGDLDTNAILLAGARDFAVVNYGTDTGGIGGRGGSRYVFVDQAVLTVGVKIGTSDALTKSGAGTLVLSNATNSQSLKALTINEGTVRATPGSSLPGGRVELRGGVLEIAGGGTYSATLGIQAGNVNWRNDRVDPTTSVVTESQKDKGSGGFAAFGAAATVVLTGSIAANALNWEEAFFLDSNHSLIFGSSRADHCLTFASNLNLQGGSGAKSVNYALREFKVLDNPQSSGDFARITGQISGPIYADLLKTGGGLLELSGDNSGLQGGIVVAEGALLVSSLQGLGAASGAYIALGAHTGSAISSLLTSSRSASVTINRDIQVHSGSTGAAILGNTIAPDANVATDATFSGRIYLGLAGVEVDRTVELHAAAGTSVSFTGGITTVAGYLGTMHLAMSGAGTVILAGTNSYIGTTTVRDARLQASAAAVIPAGTPLSILAGGEFDLNGFDQTIGSLTGGGVLNLGSALLNTGANNTSTAFTGVIHGAGSLSKAGSGTFTLTGSNDYSGGTIVAGGTLMIANTSNSATGSGAVQINSGAILKGPGFLQGTVSINTGAILSPGAAVGTLTTGPATYASGGTYRCEFSDGVAREGVGHDLHQVTGPLTLSATAGNPFVIDVRGLHLGAAGVVAHFDAHTDYGWIITSAAGGIIGFDPAKFQIVTTGFTANNPTGGGSFSIEQRGNHLVLVYTGVPFNGAGTYNGLVINNVPDHDNSGYLRVTATAAGSFSGSLLYAGFRYGLSGRVDANGDFSKSIVASGDGSTLTLSLHLDTANNRIVGSVADALITSSLVAGRTLFHTITNPAPGAGKYTVLLPADPSHSTAEYPQGNGYALMKVTAAGLVTVVGKLADGSTLTLSALLAADDSLPFYTALYPRAGLHRGSIRGNVQFQDLAALSDCGGSLAWDRPANAAAGSYPAGFTTSTNLIGSLYNVPLAGHRVLGFSNGTAVFGAGNLPSEQSAGVTLSATNKISVTDPVNPLHLKMSIQPATGLLFGSFMDPADLVVRPFSGVLFQKQQIGAGFFLGADQSGYFELITP